MNNEQETYLRQVGETDRKELLIKHTGREGIDLPAHEHAQYQIAYTLQGTLRLAVEDKEYFVPEHHLCWIPSERKHSLSSNNRKIALVIIYVPLAFSPKDARREFAVYNVNEWAAANLRYISENRERIGEATDKDLFRFALSFLRQLPLACPKYTLLLDGISFAKDARLAAALDYITRHLAEELHIDRVAKEAGISPRTLNRLLHEEHISFSAYLNYQRIIRAVELMADGKRTLAEVAYATGFSAPSNFNRTFRQILGMSPSEYAKSPCGGIE